MQPHKTLHRRKWNQGRAGKGFTDRLTDRAAGDIDRYAGDPAACNNEQRGGGDWCEPVLKTMATWVEDDAPKHKFSVFLGDNVYPGGVTSGVENKKTCTETHNQTELEAAKQRLQAQVRILKNTNSKGVFIPGNHDWGGNSGPCHEILGRQVAELQKSRQDFLGRQVAELQKLRQDFPSFHIHKLNIEPAGCPGPDKIDLEGGVRIIVMDSQWWLTDRKPNNCFIKPDWNQKLGYLLSEATNPQDTIVVTHHPVVTHGTHGGFYDWKAHLFPLTDLKSDLYVPLPIVGSLYTLYREYVQKSEQDMVGKKNMTMRKQWLDVYKEYLPFIHASGHDHNLQVLDGNDSSNDAKPERLPMHLLVSGAGSKKKVKRVGHADDTRFAYEHSGFMVVDYFDDTHEMKPDSVLLRVLVPETNNNYGTGTMVYSEWLRGGPRE